MTKVLIMGLGRGTLFAKEVLASPVLELAGFVDIKHDALEKCVGALGVPDCPIFVDLGEAIKATSPEILIVAAPTHLHAKHVSVGLNNGVHVLCEKPLTTSRKEAEDLEALSKSCGKRLAIVQNSRFGPHYKKAKKLFEEGLIGPLSHVDINFHRFRPLGGLEHAVLFNHGVHHIDVILSITGASADKVHAVEWDPPWAEKDGSGRVLRMTCHMQEGWLLNYNASYIESGEQTGQTGNYRMIGQKGSLDIRGDTDFPELRFISNQKATGQEESRDIPVEKKDWSEADRYLVEGFADAIKRDVPFETDLEHHLKTLEILFKAKDCLEN